MAGSAVIYDAGMVECRRDKAADVVADTTILIGGNMTVALACGEPGVVTGPAIVDDADMIKARR